MNLGKFGLVLFLLGLVVAGVAGMQRMSLGRQAIHANTQSVLTYDSFGSITSSNAAQQARDLRKQRDRMTPWMVGGAIAALLGLGLIFAGGGSGGATRACPKCAETVRVAAVVCKHCGAELSPMNDPLGKSSYKALAKAAEEAERNQRR
jgi:hypothetical protein